MFLEVVVGGAKVYYVMTTFNRKRLVGHANDSALSALADNLLVVINASTKSNLEFLDYRYRKSIKV